MVRKNKFKAEGALSTLLFSIARRRAIDQLRSKNSLKRKIKGSDDTEEDDCCDSADMDDDELTMRVTQRIAKAPEIQKLWRTAAETAADNEIIRQFRLWIGTLPRLQRKVAEILTAHFGDISNIEISNEIKKLGLSASVPSVKSAREQIVQKFSSLMSKEKGP
jgi:DNA-directed RNA polymerase specialized sigma24 family protein